MLMPVYVPTTQTVTSHASILLAITIASAPLDFLWVRILLILVLVSKVAYYLGSKVRLQPSM